MALLVGAGPDSVSVGNGTAAADATRNNHKIRAYDDTTTEESLWQAYMPGGYTGGDLTVTLTWMADSATTGDVVWGIAFERHDSATDLDSDSFATEQTVVGSTGATAGASNTTSLVFTSAQLDGIVAGDHFRIRIRRLGANGSDTMVGDSQLLAWRIDQDSDGFLGCRVELQSNESTANAVAEDLSFGSGSEVYDNGAWHDESTNPERLTVPAAAAGRKVRVSANVRFANNTNNERRATIRHKNSGGADQRIFEDTKTAVSGSEPTLLCPFGVTEVAEGDYFVLEVEQNSTGALNVEATDGSVNATWFAIEVVDPGLGDAEGFLGVRVELTANQSIPTGVNTSVIFGSGSTIFDEGDWHSESTNNTRITVPPAIDGKYIFVSAAARFAVNGTGVRGYTITHYNSLSVAQRAYAYSWDAPTLTDAYQTVLLGPIRVTAADYFEFDLFQGSGGNLNAVGSTGANNNTFFAAHVVGK